MNTIKTENPALILIDFQKAFDNLEYWGGQRNNKDAEKKAEKLLKLWREKKLPVFHVKHCALSLKSLLNESKEGNEFKEIVKPLETESVIKKKVNSVFIGTNLKEQLNQEGITKLVIVGLTTDHCVSATARMAGNYGYDTFVVSDATATFNKTGLNGQNYIAELMHETALASLNNEFATIVTSAVFF
ncbi:cysteine hydrolase family protein [Flavobacterium sp. '19STA2R22 D10 B1']|uniref:cysteine hydrolase family protein n=1 Tax=Flavobacterium aerium TaxID=3037261 RepID=UPI00278BBF7A|nr:cysteine hydrolase family protein [Flavobacterium sp. '19STA2R22 D10 B1']